MSGSVIYFVKGALLHSLRHCSFAGAFGLHLGVLLPREPVAILGFCHRTATGLSATRYISDSRITSVIEELVSVFTLLCSAASLMFDKSAELATRQMA